VLPFFKKSTSFKTPPHTAPFQTYDPSGYTNNGPISLSYPTYVYDSSTAFIKALSAVNVPVVKDLNLGNNTGAKQEPLVLSEDEARVSSYDGYYKPVEGRPNLTVKPMSMVQQLLLEKQGGGLTATGVIYSDISSGKTLNVTASKEVVLSLGTFQTPQL
jgi:choline dehydrogenase